MSETNLIVTEQELQRFESLSMALLATSECYKLPSAIESLIEEFCDYSESVRCRALCNKMIKDNGIEVPLFKPEFSHCSS